MTAFLSKRCAWGLLMLLLTMLPAACKDDTPTRRRVELLPGSRLVLPRTGAYTGVYADFGDTEDDVTLERIERFEDLVGKHQAIVASSSFWGESSFPAANLALIARHGAIPLVFWSPWDRPYGEGHGPDRFNLNSILAGDWDGYIDTWADAARAFNRPLLVSWGLEMNGDWFPWSGRFYGADNRLPGEGPPRYEGPEVYKRAYRYVVERVRRRGANRIQWVFHANNISIPEEPWNLMSEYYPGPDVVDWLGLSVYGKQFGSQPWITFREAMDKAYKETCRLDPSKPVIVAEWGVGEFPGSGDKAQWIRDAFAGFRKDYPRVKAAVYWHERWQNGDETYSDLWVDSTPEALDAYRQAAASPYWHGRLSLQRGGPP